MTEADLRTALRQVIGERDRLKASLTQCAKNQDADRKEAELEGDTEDARLHEDMRNIFLMILLGDAGCDAVNRAASALAGRGETK